MDNRRTIPGYKYYVDPDTGERPPVHVTFLNIYPAAEGRVNGIAFPVTAEELDQLDRRERNYDRIDVTRLLDVDLGGTVWTYLGSEAARERFAAGTAVVAQDYFDAVREDFASRRRPRRVRSVDRSPHGAAAEADARRPAASSTSAAMRRDVGSASGCHCTPSANRRSGSSIASGSSSSVLQPVSTKPSPSRRDPLVVVRLRRVVDLPGRARGERALGEPDVVVGAVERARDAAVVLVADLVGEVLPERAAAGDVHDLHAAADAEQRDVALERAPGQCELERVPLGPHAAGHRVGLGAVGGRVDVGAAGQDQAVQDVEHLVGLGLGLGVGRQHERDPARGLDGVDVVAIEEVRLRVPVAPAGALDRGADADAGAV